MAAAGVPLSVPPELRATALGNAPVSENVPGGNAGKPVDVAWNVPAAPTVKVVPVALVMVGASFTVSVKLCVVLFKPAPLAVMVKV